MPGSKVLLHWSTKTGRGTASKGRSTCTKRYSRRCKLKLPPRMIWKRLRLTLDMIKFEHSVFALPFALTGALLAFRESRYSVPDAWRIVAWIVVAMVGARSAAMTFNRILDADIDSRNPR